MAGAIVREKSGRPLLAGLLLLLDGIGSLLLSGVLLLMSVFPPVAAIEGRASVSQTQIGPALAMLVLAIACFWAGQRVLRRVRAGRLVGIVIAGLVLAFLVSVWFTGSSMDPVEIGFFLVLVAVQVLIVVGLIRWSAGADTPPTTGRLATESEPVQR